MSHKKVTFLLFISLIAQTLTSASSKEDKGQWMKGTVSAKIEGVSPEKAWPFIEDFCNAYKIFPLNVSFCVRGEPEHVAIGHRRFIARTLGVPEHVAWEKHHLGGLDRVNRVLTYRMMDNNINFSYYRSVMRVVKDQYGSELRWGYVAQAKDYTPEALRALLSFIVQTAAANIKKLASSSS